MFTLTHFGMLSLGGFLFQNALTFNILQKHHPPTPQPESNTQPQRRLPRKYGTPESPSTRNRGEEAYQGRRAHEPKGAQYQQVIITARAEPPQKWRVGTAPNSEHSNYQHIATVLPRRTIAKYFSGIHSSFRPSHTFDRTSSICLEHFE